MEQALNDLIAFLPRLLGAVLLVLAAWLVAWGVRYLTRKGMEKARVDERLSSDKRTGAKARARDDSRPSLAKTVSTAAFWIVLLLFLPLILDVLALEGLLAPVSAMINDILVALPAVFGAAIIVAAAYVIGRLVGVLVTEGLARAGFNRLGARIGLPTEQHPQRAHRREGEEGIAVTPPEGERTGGEVEEAPTTPSSIAGTLSFIAIVLFGVLAALRLMGFDTLEALVADFIVLGGQIIMGLIIFAIGLWLGNWAAGVIAASDLERSNVLGQLTRAGILVLAGAMALRQMGLANEIITLAFAFFIGAIAVAAAIAFGIGGRDVAGDVLEQWRHKVERDDVPPPTTP
jgi:hypothetical protein